MVKPEYHRYKDGGELNDPVHWVEEERTHRVVEVHQVFLRITKVETFDDAGHLLHTEVAENDAREYYFRQDCLNLMSA